MNVDCSMICRALMRWLSLQIPPSRCSSTIPSWFNGNALGFVGTWFLRVTRNNLSPPCICLKPCQDFLDACKTVALPRPVAGASVNQASRLPFSNAATVGLVLAQSRRYIGLLAAQRQNEMHVAKLVSMSELVSSSRTLR